MKQIQEYVRDSRGKMSYRKFSDMLAEYGVVISYRSIAHWENAQHKPNKSKLELFSRHAEGYGKIFCQTLLSLLKE